MRPDNRHWFLWRGAAAALFFSGEDYGAAFSLDFAYLRYLDTLQRDGMNYTRIFAGSYVEPQGAFAIQRNTLAPAPGRYLCAAAARHSCPIAQQSWSGLCLVPSEPQPDNAYRETPSGPLVGDTWSSVEDGRSLREEWVSSEGWPLRLASPDGGGDMALRIICE